MTRNENLLVSYFKAKEVVNALRAQIGEQLRQCPLNIDEDGATHLRRHYAANHNSEWPQEWHDDFRHCIYCTSAHELIEKRKAARRSLAAVQGAIFKAGKLIYQHREIVQLVNSFFKDEEKSILWMNMPNPMLGDLSPIHMMECGQAAKLKRFIETSLRENENPEADAIKAKKSKRDN